MSTARPTPYIYSVRYFMELVLSYLIRNENDRSAAFDVAFEITTTSLTWEVHVITIDLDMEIYSKHAIQI